MTRTPPHETPTSISSDVTRSADALANGVITTATTDAHHANGLEASACPSLDVAGASNLGEEPKQILDLPPDVLSVIMGYLPNVSDRFRFASISRNFRCAVHNPRMWETLNINKDLAKRLSKENEKGQNRLSQIVEYAGNDVKTLELHGTGWDVASLKTLLVDIILTTRVFLRTLSLSPWNTLTLPLRN
ncbi:F-box protein [bacterium]|nr:F-box protein [bacterium]